MWTPVHVVCVCTNVASTLVPWAGCKAILRTSGRTGEDEAKKKKKSHKEKTNREYSLYINAVLEDKPITPKKKQNSSSSSPLYFSQNPSSVTGTPATRSSFSSPQKTTSPSTQPQSSTRVLLPSSSSSPSYSAGLVNARLGERRGKSLAFFPLLPPSIFSSPLSLPHISTPSLEEAILPLTDTPLSPLPFFSSPAFHSLQCSSLCTKKKLSLHL